MRLYVILQNTQHSFFSSYNPVFFKLSIEVFDHLIKLQIPTISNQSLSQFSPYWS